MARHSRYSPEVRERAVRLFHEHAAEHPSPWAVTSLLADRTAASVTPQEQCGGAGNSAEIAIFRCRSG